MPISQTVVISCAGLGTRLNLGIPKTLIEINGKPIIHWTLDGLTNETDIRVVVGYRANDVIQCVRKIRPDAKFVFNHDYKTTNSARSLFLGSRYGNEMTVSIDGDLLVAPTSLKDFLSSQNSILGVGVPCTEDPVYCSTQEQHGELWVNGFSRSSGNVEWTGLMKRPSKSIHDWSGHVYESILEDLPIQALNVNTFEIDTPADLQGARIWAEKYLK